LVSSFASVLGLAVKPHAAIFGQFLMSLEASENSWAAFPECLM
jgi:hypothetical protein